MGHPLDPLTADEIRRTADLYRAHQHEPGVLFSTIVLDEPSREEMREFAAGRALDRRARLSALAGPCALSIAVVSLTRGEVVSIEHRDDVRPPLLIEEVLIAAGAVKDNAQWQAAMRARGIDDLDRVQLDPWPAGTFGHAYEQGRRLTRVVSYLREDVEDNGYAHPIEGVMAVVDLATGEVLEVEDTGVVPVPAERGSYYPEHVGPLRDDLKPIEITQPDGPSFVVDGHSISWQRWQLRVAMDPVEGLVLHQVGYEDAGRLRSIVNRASLAEMIVPYASTDPSHYWKNAFDAGEWGLGRMVNSLELGCDCLGEIHYLDAVMATERGEAQVVSNAVCIHEEDFGILWKHQDLHSFRTEVRRQRRLVVSSIHTVGNYEYGFYWYFYLDGTMQLEVKLTGIVQPQAFSPGDEPSNANIIAPGLAAPHHQHLFCVRLDMAVDGFANTVTEVDVETMAAGADNPHGNGFGPTTTVLASELSARRDIDPSRSRTWRVVNPNVRNRLGQPVSYKLLPGSSPTLFARDESWIARRAGFAKHNLWVTPYDPDQLRAAGDHPNQSGGGDGLPDWVEADRSVENTDLVLWHVFGVTHLVRPEDWPVMPVEYTGFHLIPVGFFDRNPALDVPPSPGHCHSD